MTKSMFRLGYTLLISGIMVAAAQPSSSAAGTKIQVTFSGSGFIGCFQYDQSQKPMPGSLRAQLVFTFNGPTVTHQICYQIGCGRHPFALLVHLANRLQLIPRSLTTRRFSSRGRYKLDRVHSRF